MPGDFTKSERKRIRQLADLVWDRGLRFELRNIAVAIDEMESGRLTPFDVTDRIHKFHDGAARDLYKQFSSSLPWLAVCRAYFDGVLTDDDITNASGDIQADIREFAASLAKLARERSDRISTAATSLIGKPKCVRCCRPVCFRSVAQLPPDTLCAL